MPHSSDLQPNQKYRVTLRLPGEPRNAIPNIRLPKVCICCNEATERSQYIHPLNSDRQRLTSSMWVPVCFKCQDHAFFDPSAGNIFFYLIGLGLLGTGTMTYKYFNRHVFDKGIPQLMLLFLSLTLLAVCVFLIWFKHWRVKRACEKGHFAGNDIKAGAGNLIIETKNKVLADLIEKHNPETFHKTTVIVS